MNVIGNFFGSFLGYLLWFLYQLLGNYGVAIIIFTIVLKAIMFPLSIKQQKSMASQSKMAEKQKELQKIYGKDKVKLNAEMQKLYEKEGVNPAGGCLPMIVPLFIMIGLYNTVIFPLQNALHVTGSSVTEAVNMLKNIPGIGGTFSQYGELEIVKHFGELKSHLTMFSGDELQKIESFSHGFNFLGLNLLETPNGSPLSSMLLLIPILCLVTSLATQFVTMKMQPGMQQQQGCMKVVFFLMPLMSVYFAYIMPSAVGFYWIISTITGFIQTVVLNQWYSPADIIAKAEARRIALLEQEEAKMQPLPYQEQRKIAEQVSAKQNFQQNGSNQKKAAKNEKQKSKNKNNKNSTDEYLGSKK